MSLVYNVSNNTYGGNGNHDSYIYRLVNLAAITIPISVFGIVANVINLVIFYRQGLKNNINFSLFCLAVSDLCALITLLWMSICYIPQFRNADLPFDPAEIQFLTGDWPHNCAVRITGGITALIVIERCMSIISPFKTHSSINSKRTRYCVMAICVFCIVLTVPVYLGSSFVQKFYSTRNRTLLGIEIALDIPYHHISNIGMNVVLLPVLFAVITGFTTVLTIRLHRQAKWRRGLSGSSSNIQQRVIKDMKIVKMMVIIAVIFVVSSLPMLITTLIMTAEVGFIVTGKYEDSFFIAMSFVGPSESFSSSVNIFVYYYMSSRFKYMLRSMFWKQN